MTNHRKRSAFTMTTEVPDGYISFGLLAGKPWVLVDLGSVSFSSIEEGREAVLEAAKRLDYFLWPEFARPLIPVSELQERLF